MNSRDLRGDLTTIATRPPQGLLDEAFLLEVKEEDLHGVGAQVVDTVLVFVAIACSNTHDRGVQILSRRLALLGHRLSLLNEILGILHLG